MTDPFFVLGALEICEEEIAEVEKVLRSGWLDTRPRVAQSKSDLASYKRTTRTHVAAVNSRTTALHVSMVAAGLDPGAEGITTPLTLCATVNANIHAALTPVLAEVDPATQCLDPAAIGAAIRHSTRAILPAHFARRPCDTDAIIASAARHGLIVIEDCAYAVETEYHGRTVGTVGDLAASVFMPSRSSSRAREALSWDAASRVPICSLCTG